LNERSNARVEQRRRDIIRLAEGAKGRMRKLEEMTRGGVPIADNDKLTWL